MGGSDKDQTPERSAEGTAFLAGLGAAIRERRSELSLAQDVLAERAGVNRTYLSEVELGRRNVGAVNIEKLARALDLRPWELLKRADRAP